MASFLREVLKHLFGDSGTQLSKNFASNLVFENEDTFASIAIDEALLGSPYLKPVARNSVNKILALAEKNSVRGACLAYRRSDEQLNTAEKRELGLRANSKMSRNAVSELSEFGIKIPLTAHEIVVGRAFGSIANQRNLQRYAKSRGRITHVQIRAMNAESCHVCAALDKDIVRLENANPLPPVSCEHDERFPRFEGLINDPRGGFLRYKG